VFYFKKKGAQRSKDKMLAEITEKIRKERKNIEWAVSSLERLTERKTKIEAGDLEQYL
jgi:predicted transcriptional regulator